MKIKQILNTIKHRPWSLPTKRWKFYQEWNNAIFLHWKVDPEELKKLIPQNLDIDYFEGDAWVSLVAFDMQKIRIRNLPAFKPISDFHEINIRTYVTKNKKPGVYFMSMEGGKKLSCIISKSLSKLPYRFSIINRSTNSYHSENLKTHDQLDIKYKIGSEIKQKTDLDKWLTERYALYQDQKEAMHVFEIHHIEWPTFELQLESLKVDYPLYKKLLNNSPDLTHYSPGVKVVAWGKDLTK